MEGACCLFSYQHCHQLDEIFGARFDVENPELASFILFHIRQTRNWYIASQNHATCWKMYEPLSWRRASSKIIRVEKFLKKYLVRLQNLEAKEGVWAATKLTTKHISYTERKMKASFATQTLNKSVETALDWLNFNLHLKNFYNSEATAKFCKMSDDAFDVQDIRSKFSNKARQKILCNEPEKFFTTKIAELCIGFTVYFANFLLYIEYLKWSTTIPSLDQITTVFNWKFFSLRFVVMVASITFLVPDNFSLPTNVCWR